ncbi:MAG: thiamine phosphate synthase [Acidobacteriota bacterium]
MIRVVVITDRRRFASEEIAGRVAAILAAVPRGAVAIQLREKDLDGGPLLRLARELIEVASPAGAPVWINDRLDVALAAGADGVHLPERGLSLADARALAGDALAIGCSRHTADDALAAAKAGAAWVQLGPVWDTPGKGPALGERALAVALGGARLVAVGGIDRPERAEAATRAGADAVAVIRAAWSSPDPGAAIAALVEAADRGCRDRVSVTL